MPKFVLLLRDAIENLSALDGYPLLPAIQAELWRWLTSRLSLLV
jgi:hypothetical protein